MYDPATLADARIPGFRYFARTPSAAVRKACDLPKVALEHHMVCDTPAALSAAMHQLASPEYTTRGTSGGHSGTQSDFDGAAKKLHSGDASYVARSDALLAKFEDLTPTRTAWANRLDVVGGAPDVQAYLAGHPMNMRRRVRVIKEAAPLGIVVDLTTSAGVSQDTMAKRGALVLALVRSLETRRPVSLHIVMGLAAGHPTDPDGQHSAVFISCEVDTKPLNLASAAYLLSSSDWRHWSFGLAARIGFNVGGTGHWPFREHVEVRRHLREIMLGAIPGADDLLCITSMHLTDRDLDNPEKWLTEQLDKYGHVEDEAA